MEFFLKESAWWALFNRVKIANLEKWWIFTLDDTLKYSQSTKTVKTLPTKNEEAGTLSGT